MTSVLVAVHNAEKTIRRCLDSLLGQTLADVQIICVDDASTDSSLDVLHEYSSQHSNIDVIALSENHGQGYARNQGIPLIKGEFTAFLDSDDWMETDALEKAEKVFTEYPQTDCVLLNVQYDYPNGKTEPYRIPSYGVMSGKEAFRGALTWDVHGWYVARTQLYRDFPFDTTCHSYSDDNVTLEHFFHSREVRWCEGKYHFVQNDGSCTHSVSMHRFEWMRANESMHNKLVAWNVGKEIIDIYEQQRYLVFVKCFRLYLEHKSQFTQEQQQFLKSELHHFWKTIDTSDCLPLTTKFKPGYMPLHPFWTLFCLQQWLYVKLR